MKENAEELHARRALEAHAFDVERIPEKAGVRRADYRVRVGSEETILEVTGKKETQFLVHLQAEARAKGVATADRQVAYWNGIDKVIKDKADQLRQTPGPATAFRVLWFSALHEDGDFITDVARRTAYGLQDLFIYANREIPYSKRCFYYNRNTFSALPDLDGIILISQAGGQLCINAFSPKRDSFRASALASMFPPRTVLDPDRWEKEERAFILDGDVDRTDQKAKWRRIYEKYRAKTTASTTNQFLGFVSIPKDLLE